MCKTYVKIYEICFFGKKAILCKNICFKHLHKMSSCQSDLQRQQFLKLHQDQTAAQVGRYALGEIDHVSVVEDLSPPLFLSLSLSLGRKLRRRWYGTRLVTLIVYLS